MSRIHITVTELEVVRKRLRGQYPHLEEFQFPSTTPAISCVTKETDLRIQQALLRELCLLELAVQLVSRYDRLWLVIDHLLQGDRLVPLLLAELAMCYDDVPTEFAWLMDVSVEAQTLYVACVLRRHGFDGYHLVYGLSGSIQFLKVAWRDHAWETIRCTGYESAWRMEFRYHLDEILQLQIGPIAYPPLNLVEARRRIERGQSLLPITAWEKHLGSVVGVLPGKRIAYVQLASSIRAVAGLVYTCQRNGTSTH